ncbi:MAG: PorV/PorQ family protein [Elusimicrobiota bacterium]
MNFLKIAFAAAALAFLSRASCAASFSDAAVGTTGAAFLEIPTSARIEAMGETMAAASSGAESIFLNPAGLAQMDNQSSGTQATEAPDTQGRSQISLDYSDLLATTYAGSTAYAYSLGSAGVLAAGLIYFSQAPQTAYDDLGNSLGSFTPSDMAFSLGYAKNVRGVRVGGDVKLIRSQIASGASGQSEAVDLGFEAPNVGNVNDGAVDVGASISNLGPGIAVGGQTSPLPTEMRGGFFWHAAPSLGLGMDADFSKDQDPYVTIGAEWTLRQPSWSAALRAGYDESVGRQGLGGFAGASAGAGLTWQNLRLDYAWAPFSDLGMTNRISIAFSF